mmetsp:Transcript_43903/g.76079  ORF Transcript_43903/g.76079 Transcript_43903/m.76079 type:complete len:156 (+) Transcript_43903:81-548(+)
MARSVSFGLGCLIFMFFSVGICSAEKVTKARLRVSTSDLPSFDQISKRRQIKRHVTNPNENAMQDSVSGLSAATYDHLSAEGAAMALHSARVRMSGDADDKYPDKTLFDKKTQTLQYFRSGSMRGVIIIVMVGVMVMVMAFECFWRLLYFRSVAK